MSKHALKCSNKCSGFSRLCCDLLVRLCDELGTRCESCDVYYDILLFLKKGILSHCYIGHCLDTLYFFSQSSES